MKLFISVDMEGIAGISDWDQVNRTKPDYAWARELMTLEAAAAVEGALAAGAKEVVVGDSHATMTNLLPEKMPTKAQLVQGRCKPISMMQGISEEFDAAAFIGYHAMQGTYRGVLAHTYAGSLIRECHINGQMVGEPALNATLAASFGVPLAFLSGDEAACREARRFVPGIETVATKKGFGTKCSQSRHPHVVRDAIRKGIQSALSRKPTLRGNRLPKPPFTLKVVLVRTEMGDLCEDIPGVERKDSMTVVFKDRSFLTVYKAFLTIMRICGVAADNS